jgi:UPF0755 protein
MKKLVLLIGIVLLAGYLWYGWALRGLPDRQVNTSVRIDPGFSVVRIAALLSQEGIVRSAFAFRIRVRLRGVDSALKAGTYVFAPNVSVDDVIDHLVTGETSETAVTIPEGFTVLDIDTLLAKRGLIMPGEFSACARTCDLQEFAFLPTGADLAERGGRVEGYLFPETYFVPTSSFSSETFMKRLLTEFRKRVVDGLSSDLAASKRSLHQIVTMASLIEEETRTQEERPVVSGILWKRFDATMGLGVDAAVRYVLNKPSAAITVTDLEIASPYNLRKFRGLPPGPIANPSIASIRAALNQ